jgi:hypothetical protein
MEAAAGGLNKLIGGVMAFYASTAVDVNVCEVAPTFA